MVINCSKEKEKTSKLLSNKNNDLIRELASKMITGDKPSSTDKEKKETVIRKGNIVSVGKQQKKTQKKTLSTKKSEQNKKTGMLAFDLHSESD